MIVLFFVAWQFGRFDMGGTGAVLIRMANRPVQPVYFRYWSGH